MAETPSNGRSAVWRAAPCVIARLRFYPNLVIGSMLSRRLAIIVPILRLDVSRARIAAWPTGVDLRCVQGDSSDWAQRAVIVPAVFWEWKGMAVPSSGLRRRPPCQRLHNTPTPATAMGQGASPPPWQWPHPL